MEINQIRAAHALLAHPTMDRTQDRLERRRRLVRYGRVAATIGAILAVFLAAPYVMAAEQRSMFTAWAIATLIGLPVVWAYALEDYLAE
jgi:uncharacterized sodium:solute symporter family permease YidK